jgi:hypothetical protein
MKCLVTKACVFLFLIPALATAGWQVAKPTSAISKESSFKAGVQQNSSFVSSPGSGGIPNQVTGLGRPVAVYAISVSGSLKENVERIMYRYHWKVLWKVPYDFNFDGRVTGSSLPDVIQKLLSPFPLQAVLYMSNRTMTVIPRKL